MTARAPAAGGRLIANLMHFARTLRAAGLAVGPGKVIDAVDAVRAVGITDRRDFYWTLHAVFVNRPEQRLIFDQAVMGITLGNNRLFCTIKKNDLSPLRPAVDAQK